MSETPARPRGRWVIAATLLAALVLAVLPLPEAFAPWRPRWAALILIYWCMALPHRVGVGTAWATGLFEDVLTGTLLGQHALTLAVLAYLVIKLHQRLRLFPLRQQMLAVLVLLLLGQLLDLWIRGFTGRSPETWAYWGASLTGTLLWPWVFTLLRTLRRRLRVT
ncbi:rod shape-determining protein MreD [Inmirania thermothiophila]|uniref:Rod shape-determining protein MreD n=1 Tax=Inmirania thermothiophila TaxID=1750597 RepID=A0A3N1Y784_9GAMM|nr:rod shape-determining protein MreD [Inmirania thermothiophila]ROR34689.1 rod shape-determining protein MreD [Inmirania thermothiophila]